MKNGWGVMTGLGMAGLLVAGTPAWAGGGSAGSTSDTSSSSGSAMGSTGSTSDPASGSTMGTPSGSTASEQSASAMGSTGSNEVTGKVEKFDRTNKELTLSLKVSDSTQVTKDGQTASLSDIKEGDQVRASFSGSGETLEVTQIEVMSKGSTASPPSGSTGTSDPSGTIESPGSGSTGTGSGSADPGSTGTTGSSPGGSSGRGY
jgi:Cu/Ag efflux protein CusF